MSSALGTGIGTGAGGAAPLEWSSARFLPLAFVALLAWVLLFDGSRGLWEPDEGRYTAVALEMLERGDFLIPAVHREQLHLTKPPLTYWAIASSVALLGRREWAVRLPNALAFVGTCGLLFLLGRKVLPRRPWLPTLVYALSLLPFAAAGIVTTDTLLTLWMTFALYGYVGACIANEQQKRAAFIVVAWIGFGIAFLTKGPPGILPLLSILAFALATRGRRRAPRLFAPTGLVCFALLAFGWFALAAMRVPGLLSDLLRLEVFDRVASNMHARHGEWWGAFVVYVPTLVLGTLPWTRASLAALREAWGLRRRDARRRAVERDPIGVLLWLWLLVPLAVLFLARSRLPLYLIPIFPPLALLVARCLDREVPFCLTRARTRVALSIWIVLLVALKAVVAHIEVQEDSREYARYLAKVVHEPFDEVEFVDTRPHYGLTLYLPVEVETIALRASADPSKAGWQTVEELAEELRHDERRVMVVAKNHRRQFERELARLGNSPRWIGRRGNELICTLEPHGPAKVP